MLIKDLDNNYIVSTYLRYPITLVKGKGSYVYDDKGNKYIDMATGIAVNTFGISNKIWKKAVIKQINKIQHTSNLFYSEPSAKLAKILCEKTGLKKVFFSNSGAEANECAIKTARKYAQDKKGKDYFSIITLKNSFHGRTITTLSATGQEVFHKDFLPLTEGFIYAEANNIESVENLLKTNKVAAIMIECIQGEGGVIALDNKFIKGVYSLCKKNDVLMICDEVQSGNGRSGKFFSYMNYDVEPDIVTTAKGLGGGLPIGATLFGEKVKNVLTYSTHGSTFGGNPLATAGAISVVERIDNKLLNEVNEKSKFIFESLNGSNGIKNVTGLGLMIGIETEKPTDEVIKICQQNGVLVIKAKNKIRLLPALNIPEKLLIKAINVIKNACS